MINVDHGYVHSPDQLKLTPTAAKGIDLLRDWLVDRDTGMLLEHFAADWAPHPNPAMRACVEPGHHFGWRGCLPSSTG